MNMENLRYFEFALQPFSNRTLNLLDLALFFVIITLFALSRFNEWAENSASTHPDPPSEYIARSRYNLYCLIYSLPFFLFSLLLFTLEFDMPVAEITALPTGEESQTLGISGLITAFFEQLGPNTLSLPLIYLLALINIKPFSKPEFIWRKKLQAAARIPENAMQLKNDLINSYYAPNLDPHKKSYLLSRQSELGLAHHWQQLIEQDQDLINNPVAAYFLNAFTLYHSAVDLKALAHTDEEAARIGRRLNELNLVLQQMEHDQRLQVAYSDELRQMIDTLSERTAKHIVRHWPDPKAQYQVMRSSLHIGEFQDFATIPSFKWLFSACAMVFIATYLAWFAYVEISALMDGRRMPDDLWHSWFLSSFSLYLACILLSLIAAVSYVDRKEGFDTTLLVVVTSLSAVLCYFYFSYFAQQSFAMQWVLLSCKHALLTAGIFVALARPPGITRKRSLHSSAKIAALTGVVGAAFQPIIVGQFRNVGFVDAPGVMALAAVFGFFSSFLVTAICCYYVEEFKRFRFVNNRRRSMRVPVKKGSDLIANDRVYPVTIYDLSERGARVQKTGTDLEEGNEATLTIYDASVKARVRWQNGDYLGLDFQEDTVNTSKLRRIIARELQLCGAVLA